MTTTSAGPTGWSNTGAEHRAGTGQFMLTLCRLPGPVSIRPPQSPQLKPFTFFTTRELGPDGNEHFDLHMGYFETLAGAEKWVEGVRARFPNAIATIAPTAFVRPPEAEAPASQPADPRPEIAESGPFTAVEDRSLSDTQVMNVVENSHVPAMEDKSLSDTQIMKVVEESHVPAAEDRSLTDTQVMRILETRGAARGGDGVDERHGEPIALLRPDDTGSRHALKEAVVQGAPVAFVVQLLWSARPMDLNRVPSLAIFKAHTLYATESRREGRSRYFLRLGFFDDPISAKQVAAELHPNFASAAVVPVSDQEVARAREAGKGSYSIPCLVQQEVTRAVDSSTTPRSPAASTPVSDARRQVSRDEKSLELALRRLARREMWTNPDLFGESGVRHLRVKVEPQRREPHLTVDPRTSR
jgi:hypothetical protein